MTSKTESLQVLPKVKFIKDDFGIKQGKSLCRLGFAFPEFNNYKIDIKTDKLVTFDCFLSDNIGGSGISIKISNKKDFIEALSAYIGSYF